jgi:hypothetical protein
MPFGSDSVSICLHAQRRVASAWRRPDRGPVVLSQRRPCRALASASAVVDAAGRDGTRGGKRQRAGPALCAVVDGACGAGRQGSTCGAWGWCSTPWCAATSPSRAAATRWACARCASARPLRAGSAAGASTALGERIAVPGRWQRRQRAQRARKARAHVFIYCGGIVLGGTGTGRGSVGAWGQDLCRRIVKGKFECPSFMSADVRDLIKKVRSAGGCFSGPGRAGSGARRTPSQALRRG